MQLVLPKGKVKVPVFLSLYSPLFACSFLKYTKSVRMNIFINQQPKDIPDPCSLEQLLTQVLNIPVAGLAVAVDQTVIPSTDWAQFMLHAADKVMLIRATQGG
jgi:sulfur carrier protein